VPGGIYHFTNLPEGTYKVRVTVPDGFVAGPVQNVTGNADANGENDSNIDISSGLIHTSGEFDITFGGEPQEADTFVGDNQDSSTPNVPGDASDLSGNMTIDMGFVQPMSIGSFVWEDKNLDGIQNDGATSGIADATVALFVDDGTGAFIPAIFIGGAAVPATMTGTNGQYFFNNLPEGNYKVRVTPPVGYEPTTIQVNADDSSPAAVNGTRFSDSNIDTAATPPARSYESPIIVLTPGQEEAEIGSLPGDAQDGTSGAADLAGNMSVDFGFVQPVSIGSYVWEDLNNDGTQSPSEPPIQGALVDLLVEDTLNPGVFIVATDLTGAAVAQQTTGSDGLYYFDNLPEGNYKVVMTSPAGFVVDPTKQTTANDDDSDDDSNIASSVLTVHTSGEFALEAGTEPVEADDQAGDDQDGINNGLPDKAGNMTVDFGLVRPASVGNYIWLDENSDGLQDAGEPGIPNVTVDLRDALGNLLASTITDANGGYLFT
ncbi:MAG: hypothetical protein KAG70_08645, partial [Alcanivorax sp.]|nr:hypothetical protein [Alcanivorax sp.]